MQTRNLPIPARLLIWGARFLLTPMLLSLGAGRDAFCQENPSPVAVAAAAAKVAATRERGSLPAPSATSPKSAGPSSVSADQALYLVRSTLLTLNDANRSGNYTVLRDLAAPGFQRKNTAADLAQSFSDLRGRNFDLFASALLPAQFTRQPAKDTAGRLRLIGFFATRPQRISFDLTFEVVNGQWRLLAISIATQEAPVTQSAIRPSAPAHDARLFYGLRLFSGTAGLRW